MLNTSDSIIVGVLTGIITSFIIWFLLKIFNRIVIPWYQSIIYQDVLIEGTWYGFRERVPPGRETEPSFLVSLTQNSHKIKGEIVVLKIQDNSSDQKILQAEGVLKDGNLILTYKPKDRARLGGGCFVLKLENDAKDLVGKCLFISANRGNVAENEALWKRKA